jgi:hypothetical protein
LKMHYLIVILFVPVLKLYSVFYLFSMDKPSRCLSICRRWFIYPVYGIDLLSSSKLLNQSPEYIVLIGVLLHLFIAMAGIITVVIRWTYALNTAVRLHKAWVLGFRFMQQWTAKWLTMSGCINAYRVMVLLQAQSSSSVLLQGLF